MSYLSGLSKYYDFEIIKIQNDFTLPSNLKIKIRNKKWFLKKHTQYDRILYHIGNNVIHKEALNLLRKVPGVVFLHDFYLPHFIMGLSVQGFYHELINSHGFHELAKVKFSNTSEYFHKFPCSFSIFQLSLGVLVHSEFAKTLTNKYYGQHANQKTFFTPIIKEQFNKDSSSIEEIKKDLGFEKNDFIICSFGFITEQKCIIELIDSFSKSYLSKKENIFLVLVGEIMESEDYRKNNILYHIKKLTLEKKIRITGYIEEDIYNKYLSIANIAVQLRKKTYGETSAAVLDCLRNGVPLIVSKLGAMNELDQNSVLFIKNSEDTEEIMLSLESLYENPSYRNILSQKSQKLILKNHDLLKSSKIAYNHIEYIYETSKPYLQALQKTQFNKIKSQELYEYIRNINLKYPIIPNNKSLFIDVTAISRIDLKTGIQRVIRAQVIELLNSMPKDYNLVPIYMEKSGFSKKIHYKSANSYILNLLGISHSINESIVEFKSGDILYIADLHPEFFTDAYYQGLFSSIKEQGVSISIFLHDLLPATRPQFFLEISEKYHKKWYDVIPKFADNIICISKNVADELHKWIKDRRIIPNSKLHITYNHLGADISESVPSKGLPLEANLILNNLKKRLTFLMVGTIEPRKGHSQAIMAFEILWKLGFDVNLVIVGKQGWESPDPILKYEIPAVMRKLHYHNEKNNRLYWMNSISDEYLEKIYTYSSCLLYPSEAEGFGLPLIEAARHKLPIIVRDIPLFREVVNDYGFYFSDTTNPNILAESIQKWCNLFIKNQHPKSDKMPWITWADHVKRLKEILLQRAPIDS